MVSEALTHFGNLGHNLTHLNKSALISMIVAFGFFFFSSSSSSRSCGFLKAQLQFSQFVSNQSIFLLNTQATNVHNTFVNVSFTEELWVSYAASTFNLLYNQESENNFSFSWCLLVLILLCKGG